MDTQVDTIDPVAGVTVLEGGRKRQGPKVIEVSINILACHILVYNLHH